jgi:DNA-binding NtrC family response regulator
MPRLRILIADDEKAARHGMSRALAHADYELCEVADGKEALAAIRDGLPDLVFLDLNMPGLDGLAVLRELGPAGATMSETDPTGRLAVREASRPPKSGPGRSSCPGSLPAAGALEKTLHTCEIVIVTANDSIATAVECMRHGAADYITKPFEIEQLRAIARRAARRLELERQVAALQTQLDEKHAFGALVGVSRPMRALYEQISRAARAPIDILVCGETGTGKEMIAREIHRLSDRAAAPFVAVNTAAIAESLAESELFGHVRGSFTGANADRRGVFEQARGGMLFLDEIGDMPLPAQAKILRTLQERTVQPVGSDRTTHVDVRVISATHQNLEEAIAAGQFRQDLYYRIRGVQLLVPPLRSRREDILVLANYFLDRWGTRTGRPSPQLAPDAVDRLLGYHWPGNVRELEQAISAAAAMVKGELIRDSDLGLAALPPPPAAAVPADLAGLPLNEAKARLVESFERAAIMAALEQHRGNVSAAARQLGLHRQSLQQKMTQLGISRS